MNTKTILSLLLVSSLALISCKKELEPQESSSSAAVVAPTAETANPNTATAATPAQMQQNTAVASPNTATPAAPANTAKGMNPAHGQPGHRCDIPVGAPLNSPPGKTASPQPNTQFKQTGNDPVTVTPSAVNPGSKTTAPTSNYTTSGTPAILNTPAATAPGMNPPHGQAGHRCEVAVGAPLPK